MAGKVVSLTQWNGTVDWNNGLEHWNGTLKFPSHYHTSLHQWKTSIHDSTSWYHSAGLENTWQFVHKSSVTCSLASSYIATGCRRTKKVCGGGVGGRAQMFVTVVLHGHGFTTTPFNTEQMRIMVMTHRTRPWGRTVQVAPWVNKEQDKRSSQLN